MPKLQPWQQQVVNGISQYQGRGVLQITGRQAGKSYFSAAALKRLMDDLQNRPIEDLVLSEGKVFGARYYCVEPIGGNWVDMKDWCLNIYGPAAEIWEAHNFMWPDVGRWYINDRRFWFRDEKDRTMFLLRWR